MGLRGIIPNVLSKSGYELNDILKQLYQYITKYKNIVLFTDSDPDGYHILILIYGFVIRFFPYNLEKIYVIDSMKYHCPTRNDLTNEDKCDKSTCKHQYLKGIGSLKRELLEKQLEIIKKINFSEKLKNIIQKILSNDSLYRGIFLKHSLDDSMDIINRDIALEDLEITDPTNEDEYYITSKIQEYIRYKTSRTIPSLIDGLTTVGRKIIYCLLVKRYSSAKGMLEILGDIYKNMNYHHGDNSLIESLFVLSSEFVGGLNFCPLIATSGQGTRIKFGKDHPKARYASVEINKMYLDLFLTDEIYEIQKDGNKNIEPVSLFPILPLILINGCRGGVGFGVRCNILPHDPVKIIELIEKKLSDEIENFEYPNIFLEDLKVK